MKITEKIDNYIVIQEKIDKAYKRLCYKLKNEDTSNLTEEEKQDIEKLKEGGLI